MDYWTSLRAIEILETNGHVIIFVWKTFLLNLGFLMEKVGGGSKVVLLLSCKKT